MWVPSFLNLPKNLPKNFKNFGNFCKLFEKYELEKRYRGILFYSFQYIVTWLELIAEYLSTMTYDQVAQLKNLIYIA